MSVQRYVMLIHHIQATGKHLHHRMMSHHTNIHRDIVIVIVIVIVIIIVIVIVLVIVIEIDRVKIQIRSHIGV